jgi:hypothetical protein
MTPRRRLAKAAPEPKKADDLLKFRNCPTSVKTIKKARAEAAQTGANKDLAEHAAMIRRLGKRVLTDIIEIGRRLTKAKEIVIGQGNNWEAWLKAEFGWTKQTSLNFERVYELSQSKNFLPDATIAPSALYLLVRPSTPKEVRDQLLDRAKEGENISVNDANKALKEARKEEQEPDDDAGGSAENEASNDKPEDPQTKNNKRWFRDVCGCAAQAKRFAKTVDNAEPDLAQALREIAEPGLLSTLREGGQALIRLADFFDGLLQEERQALAEAAE